MIQQTHFTNPFETLDLAKQSADRQAKEHHTKFVVYKLGCKFFADIAYSKELMKDTPILYETE